MYLPWSDASAGRLADEIGQHAICLVEDIALLLDRHVFGVLVGVPVQTDLVACITHSGHLFREGLQGVAWDEPGGLDVVFLEEFQQTLCSHGRGPVPCRMLDSPARTMSRYSPRLISLVESSPPYEPSQPATASTSTPYVTRTRFLPIVTQG